MQIPNDKPTLTGNSPKVKDEKYNHEKEMKRIAEGQTPRKDTNETGLVSKEPTKVLADAMQFASDDDVIRANANVAQAVYQDQLTNKDDFAAMQKKVSAMPQVENAQQLCEAIGRKKLGKQGFERMMQR